MKVIGATKYTLLVEMSTDEFEVLTPKNINIPTSQRDLQHWAGREFAMRDAWDRLRPILENQKKLNTIVGQLKAMGELLEPIIPEIERLTGGEASATEAGL